MHFFNANCKKIPAHRSAHERVSSSVIVENKRLRHALSIVKTQQDRRPAVKIMINSEKIGYKKHPYRVYGTEYEVQSERKRLVLNE